MDQIDGIRSEAPSVKVHVAMNLSVRYVGERRWLQHCRLCAQVLRSHDEDVVGRGDAALWFPGGAHVVVVPGGVYETGATLKYNEEFCS